MKVQTLKGFRDFLPAEAKKRQYVIETLRKVFESYGFEPLETPALEYEEILLGKYGEEGDKLMYRFEDLGKRRVALRYDQTVPLARVVAQYQNQLPMPFKRYQIQNVWRAENTQKGRYREFLQCDADIVGNSSPLSDAEIIMLVFAIYKKLNLDVIIKINDRANLNSLEGKYIAAIDKLEKIGESAVLAEMVEKGMNDTDAKLALKELQNKPQTENIGQIIKLLEKMGCDMSKIQYESTLARGLNYYTGIIFETTTQNNKNSICSGGRYDKLVRMFSGKDIPAIGFGLGFDRTIEAMEELNLFPKDLQTTKVLVTIFSPELKQQSLDCATALRSAEVSTELYLDENAKLEKQLKYADQKGIPFAIVIGSDEAKNNTVTLKTLKTREQKTIKKENLVEYLSHST